MAKNQAEWSAGSSHSFHCIMCWGMLGGWVRTPTESAGIAVLRTHRGFCGMFFPWILWLWGMLEKPSHTHIGPDHAHVLSLAVHPLRFQMCLGGIYRCRVGILQSISANINSNYVKKMPVAFSEEEYFFILAMPSHWIIALSQNTKTSVCKQLAFSAFHGTKGIDKTTLLHPSLLNVNIWTKRLDFFLLSTPLRKKLEKTTQLFFMCNSQSSMVRNSSTSMSFPDAVWKWKNTAFF